MIGRLIGWSVHRAVYLVLYSVVVWLASGRGAVSTGGFVPGPVYLGRAMTAPSVMDAIGAESRDR